MTFIIWIIMAVLILTVLGGILVVAIARRNPSKSDGMYPEGYYIGIGMAIGIPIGMPIGLAMGNIALGPAIGIPIGLAIGSGMEAKAKKEGRIRPLTKEEKKRQKTAIWFGIVSLGLLMFIGISAYFILVG